ncbi:MAG: redoxin family protein [Planctomycetota bacterium]|jgi:thiol-disulfide isomerase/thioredoxin
MRYPHAPTALHSTAKVAFALALACLTGLTAQAGDDVDRRWLDRLDDEDRSALDAAIGYAPPAMAGELRWVGGTATTWDALRGKVVLIQSWTSRSSAGRSAPVRALRTARGIEGGDEIVVLALHTPEGADTAETFPEAPVIIDAEGAFCDDLGVYKRPVNVLVDRQGAVRYAGLNKRGLEGALKRLLAETYDENAVAAEAPAAEPKSAAEFPPYSNKVTATDVRGRNAPEFFVQEWITPRPDAKGKVVIIDFWATWCGPCVASIPHMNELAGAFRSDVTVVGVSSESNGKFKQGMQGLAQRKGITLDTFGYAIALDPSQRMFKAIGGRGIPHVLVMSPDWVVRYQGHPSGLSRDILGQIVDASKSVGGPAARRARWRK